MTTTEQIQQLNEAVSALQTQVASLTSQLSSETNKLNLHLVDSDSDIAQLNAKTNLLDKEDTEIHDEIHEVSLEVDNHEGRINNLEISAEEQGVDIQGLKDADTNFQQQLDDMDVEHHEELHNLGLAIDAHTERLNNLEIFEADSPEHVVLSEAEYDEMGEHDYDTFYFVYEEE